MPGEIPPATDAPPVNTQANDVQLHRRKRASVADSTKTPGALP
jgi:hypothetical protein